MKGGIDGVYTRRAVARRECDRKVQMCLGEHEDAILEETRMEGRGSRVESLVWERRWNRICERVERVGARPPRS